MKYLILFLLLNTAWAQDHLIPLETDFCTNFPDGPRENPTQWKHCCLTHDMYFWAGGTKADRFESDLELKSCITNAGAPRIAELMYRGVRLGSYSPIKYSKKKWNHGWPNRREFQALSTQDINLLEAEINSGYKFISPEIKTHFIQQLRSRAE